MDSIIPKGVVSGITNKINSEYEEFKVKVKNPRRPLNIQQLLGVIIVIIITWTALRLIHYSYDWYVARKTAHEMFNITPGEAHTQAVDEAIDRYKKELQRNSVKDEERALIQYRIGQMYLTNVKDPKRARYWFNNAVEEINRDVKGGDAIKRAKHNRFVMNQVQNFQDTLNIAPDRVNRATVIANQPIPAPIKRPEQNVAWHQSPQTAHDSLVVNEFAKTFARISELNSRESLRFTKKDQEDLVRFGKEIGASPAISRMLLSPERIAKIGAKEDEILKQTYLRIVKSRANNKNRQGLLDAFRINLQDMIEPNGVVCAMGRVTRLMSTFTKIDDDPRLGNFHTRESIRNEIFVESGKLLNERLNSLPEHVRTDYNNDNQTQEVKIFINRTKKGMANFISNKYGKFLSPRDLKLVIGQAQAGV